MKHFLTSAFFIFLLSTVGVSQTVQFGVKAGSQPNSVAVTLKAIGPVTNIKFSEISFVIQVPNTVGTRPDAQILTGTPGSLSTVFTAWNELETPSEDNGYYIYSFSSTPPDPPAISIADGAEQVVTEIRFMNGDVNATAKVRVAHLAMAGPETKFQIYASAGGSPIIDYRKMVYSANGGAVSPVSLLASEQEGYDSYQFSEVSVNVNLPVKFLSFLAIKDGDNAKLNWTVENDFSNKEFRVERSTNGRDFSNLTTVAAKGNGSSTNNYEITDVALNRLSSSVVYYRIKQVDFNGAITYSNIKSVSLGKGNTGALLYPNPARSNTTLSIDITTPGKYAISVRDIRGRLVQTKDVQFVRGVNNQVLGLEGMASGEYNVQIMNANGFKQQLKLIKTL